MKKLLIPLVLSILDAIGAAVYLFSIPNDAIPTHYDLAMNPDQYGSKWTMMLFPAICVLLSILFIVYRKLTRNKENHKKNVKYEDPFIITIIIVFIIFGWFMTLAATGTISPNRTWLSPLMIALGILIAIGSNYFGKLKQNPNFGIKIRATLKNEHIWKKTHRLSGVLGVIGGAVMVICGILGFFLDGAQIILFASSLVFALVLFGIIPSIYAEVLYSKLGSDEKNDEITAEN